MLLEPKRYQTSAIDFVVDTPRCALHAGVGSGKTVISLTAFYELFMNLEVSNVLFVAPLNVILNTVPDEIAKWDHLQDLSYSVLHGDHQGERIKANTQVHLINYEGLEWLLKCPDRPKYDMVVLDEAHSFKDHRTRRFKMLAWLLQHTPRVVQMTGTPIGNSLLDLWAQYYLLDFGQRLLRSYEHYRAKYFEQADYMGYKWTAYDWSEVAIIEEVQDITFQVHPDDVKLTALSETPVSVDLSRGVLDAYTELEKNYFLEIDEAEIEAWNAVTLSTKLRQLANGFLYHGDPNVHRRETVVVHDEKFDKLKAMLDFYRQQGENVMVVATFAQDFERLEKFFPGIPQIHGRKTKIEARRHIVAWNKGELPIMAIHPRSVGTGLNLQHGGRTQIWLSPDWSYLSKHQTIGRVHRTGQELDVIVKVLVAVGTIDEMILEAVAEKRLTSESFAEKLKQYRKLKLGG